MGYLDAHGLNTLWAKIKSYISNYHDATKIDEAPNDNKQYARKNKSWAEVQTPSHVGMIVMSTTLSTENLVKQHYGGTSWSLIQGRFLLGAGTNGSDTYAVNSLGGESTHTLTTDEMPTHNHYAYGWAAVKDGSGAYPVLGAKYDGGGATQYTRNTGGGQGHNNMPPYKAVYIWERVS